MKKTVTVYGKENCQPCRLTKHWFRTHDFEVVEVDVALDKDAMKHLQEKGFQSLPVVFVDGHEPISGFVPSKFEALINKGQDE